MRYNDFSIMHSEVSWNGIHVAAQATLGMAECIYIDTFSFTSKLWGKNDWKFNNYGCLNYSEPVIGLNTSSYWLMFTRTHMQIGGQFTSILIMRANHIPVVAIFVLEEAHAPIQMIRANLDNPCIWSVRIQHMAESWHVGARQYWRATIGRQGSWQ